MQTKNWDAADMAKIRVLVLAGPDAADARTLKALGVPANNIVAVDHDAAALKSARELVPEATYVHDDIRNIVRHKKFKQSFHAMMLDFCSPMSDTAISDATTLALLGLRHGGLFGFGFMYGREGPQTRAGVAWHRKLYETQTAVLLARPDEAYALEYQKADKEIYPTLEEFAADRREALQTDLDPTALARRPRAFYALRKFVEASMKLGSILLLHRFIFYRSGRRVEGRSRGVPMVYGLGEVHRPFLQGVSRKVLHQKLWREVDKFISQGHPEIDQVDDDPDGYCIRSTAVEFAQRFGSPLVADLLNLRKEQVAAWCAVATKQRFRWVDEWDDEDHPCRCPQCGNTGVEGECLTETLQVYVEVDLDRRDAKNQNTHLEFSIPAHTPTRCLECGYEGPHETFQVASLGLTVSEKAQVRVRVRHDIIFKDRVLIKEGAVLGGDWAPPPSDGQSEPAGRPVIVAFDDVRCVRTKGDEEKRTDLGMIMLFPNEFEVLERHKEPPQPLDVKSNQC